MFKRANKVTALLVAAASVMATVPAMAADSVRLGNKEGTVKQGIAYGDGSYAYYGYRTDDDDTGVYYNNDGGATKEKLDSDLEDYRLDSDSKYGTKYAYARESSNKDEYLVDLSSGKIDEDNTAEEKLDNAKAKLVTNIKKADRYENIIDKTGTFDNIIEKGNGSFDQILRGQFGDVWYKYSVTTPGATNVDMENATVPASYVNYDTAVLDSHGANITSNAQARFIGFTNDSGKYIDLSKETNIRVFSTKTGRAETIKEYGEKDKDAQLTVNLIDVQAVAQDKDNIYAITTVEVIDDYANDPKFVAAHGIAQPTYQYFLQKISKTQGGKDDDEAYTAKEITSYQISNNKEIYDNGDMSDAYKALFYNGDKGIDNKLVGITVKDSSLYVVRVDAADGDKLHVYKLDMKKYKDKAKVGSTLTKDVDYNGLGQDDDMDDGDLVEFEHDFVQSAEDEGINHFEKVLDYNVNDGTTAIQLAGQDLYRIPSVSIDTTGSVWALEKGKVIKVDEKLKKNTVYTVDRAMDALDVYDENNLIVWDTEGDVYTNISEGKKQTADDGIAVNPAQGQPATTTAAQVGWVQDTATGAWNFYNVNGVKQANYWANDNGTWYWIKEDGTMATGWAKDTTGTWYYLNPTSGNQGKALGAMLTGWQQVDGAWYYMTGSGAMAANTTIDGYYVGANGAWVQ